MGQHNALDTYIAFREAQYALSKLSIDASARELADAVKSMFTCASTGIGRLMIRLEWAGYSLMLAVFADCSGRIAQATLPC